MHDSFSEVLAQDPRVGRLAIGLDDDGRLRPVHFCQSSEAVGHRGARSRSPTSGSSFPLSLSLPIRLREPSAAGKRSGFQVDDEVAAPPDQDRQGHRSQPAAVLEGLELVELELSTDATACAGSSEHPPMKAAAVQPEQLQTACDGATGAVQDAAGLTVSDFGCEQAHQLQVQSGLSEPVVEPEGLDGKGPPAGAAAESLDGAAVAQATEVAMAAKAKALTTGSGAARMRATKRSVAHENLLSEARSGLGPTVRTEVYARGFRRIGGIRATAAGARFRRITATRGDSPPERRGPSCRSPARSGRPVRSRR